MANLNASIGGSASISEYDEDDEVRRAKRKHVDKGKWKARHEEDTGGDFCDDNGMCIALIFTRLCFSPRIPNVSNKFYAFISLLTISYI
jgi:hypothetical protein